jgi:hypothetical protein
MSYLGQKALAALAAIEGSRPNRREADENKNKISRRKSQEKSKTEFEPTPPWQRVGMKTLV